MELSECHACFAKEFFNGNWSSEFTWLVSLLFVGKTVAVCQMPWWFTYSPNIIMVDNRKIFFSGALLLLEEEMPIAILTGFTRSSKTIEYAKENRIALTFTELNSIAVFNDFKSVVAPIHYRQKLFRLAKGRKHFNCSLALISFVLRLSHNPKNF